MKVTEHDSALVRMVMHKLAQRDGVKFESWADVIKKYEEGKKKLSSTDIEGAAALLDQFSEYELKIIVIYNELIAKTTGSEL